MRASTAHDKLQALEAENRRLAVKVASLVAAQNESARNAQKGRRRLHASDQVSCLRCTAMSRSRCHNFSLTLAPLQTKCPWSASAGARPSKQAPTEEFATAVKARDSTLKYLTDVDALRQKPKAVLCSVRQVLDTHERLNAFDMGSY